MNIETLIERAKAIDADLDDEVHEAKADEASDINNGGISRQVAYLVVAYGYERTEQLLTTEHDTTDADDGGNE